MKKDIILISLPVVFISLLLLSAIITNDIFYMVSMLITIGIIYIGVK